MVECSSMKDMRSTWMKKPGSSRWEWYTAGLVALWLMSHWLLAVDLVVDRPDAQGWLRLSSEGQTDRVQTLQRSVDLRTWTDIALLQDGPWKFPDTTAGLTMDPAFYRVQLRLRQAGDDAKNAVKTPEDRFANEPVQYWESERSVRWIKFAILRDAPDRVYYQNSEKYAFHYDFGKLWLPGMEGVTREMFDQWTLYRENQKAVLGALVLPPDPVRNEYGIQLVGLDAYSREEVLDYLERVRASVWADPGVRVLYMPTHEQKAVADAHGSWFQERGFEVGTLERWTSADICYSAGWALGRLVYVPVNEIEDAYADGRLGPMDILLTDYVPVEIPFVSGIITLNPATPNSHVAILARSYGVPFGWPADPAVQQFIQGLAGREILLRLDTWGCRVMAADADGAFSAELREAILDLKRPAPLAIQPVEYMGKYSVDTLGLGPDDVRYVGGKAANFGTLRRALPENSQEAIALTFDLWRDFMDQTLPGGMTLREAIHARLEPLSYPPNFGQVREDLEWIRQQIRSVAEFSPAQQAAILELLQDSGLPTDRRLRFRSSTNVEDTEHFTGAGLYSSYSGCVQDDLNPGTGPSYCNPDRPTRQGVFRAIQRVYASFYNDNAFFERLRYQVDESQVGMAVLVHESFPDPDELANGVATLNWSRGFGGNAHSNWDMVTQLGAESVTNPVTTARPEIVRGWSFGQSIGGERVQSSGLVPLGASIMEWDAEYLEFARLFHLVADEHANMHTGRNNFILDLEYKKSASRGLQIKQVREIPRPKQSEPIVPYLLNEPILLSVLEGEYGDIFALHRLKSDWQLATRSLHMIPEGVTESLFQDMAVRFLHEITPQELADGPSTWPGAGFERTEQATLDRFIVSAGDTEFRLHLETWLPGTVSGQQSPVLTTRDLTFFLIAKYGAPQLGFNFGEWTQSQEDTVPLVVAQSITETSLRQERSLAAANGLLVETTFYWPEPPRGISAGYTAPNIGFVSTRIEGLTTEPILLTARAAQTYHPHHHNFAEEFLFEPVLDPNLTSGQRAELDALEIRQLLLLWDMNEVQAYVVAENGTVRPWK